MKTLALGLITVFAAVVVQAETISRAGKEYTPARIDIEESARRACRDVHVGRNIANEPALIAIQHKDGENVDDGQNLMVLAECGAKSTVVAAGKTIEFIGWHLPVLAYKYTTDGIVYLVKKTSQLATWLNQHRVDGPYTAKKQYGRQ